LYIYSSVSLSCSNLCLHDPFVYVCFFLFIHPTT
jgi:hypothetical protein